jgi:L-threonylcarbamoyladenylate synthase
MSGPEKNGLAHVIKVNPDEPDIVKIRKAATIIREGGLVAFPTETVYGLGANALNEEAVNKIFRIKKRPSSDPIIVHISEMDELETVVKSTPELAYKLAERFWPGPLTMIMQRSDNIPSNVSAGLLTVAVRMPSHRISVALIRESGVPIAAPSANIFSRPSSTRAQHIIDDFSDSVDMIIDGGDSTIGLESTVLDLTSDPPVLLRPGGTPMEALKQVIPNLQFGPKYLKIEDSKASTSPGMLTKHYSPRAQLLLFKGPVDRVREKMREKISELLGAGKKIGLLLPSEDIQALDLDVESVDLGSENDLEKVGKNLFSGLRELDNLELDVILVRSLNSEGLGLAILDRMIRASEGKMIIV